MIFFSSSLYITWKRKLDWMHSQAQLFLQMSFDVAFFISLRFISVRCNYYSLFFSHFYECLWKLNIFETVKGQTGWVKYTQYDCMFFMHAFIVSSSYFVCPCNYFNIYSQPFGLLTLVSIWWILNCVFSSIQSFRWLNFYGFL